MSTYTLSTNVTFTNAKFNMNPLWKMTYPELVTWLLGTSSLQENHPFHSKNMPDWVPAWVQFRQHAENLNKAVKAAENKDVEKAKERDQEHMNTLLSINTNACYVVMRAKHENDEELLHDMGYELKEKTKRSHSLRQVSKKQLQVKVKRGTELGSVVITIEKDPGAGLYRVQICKGEPAGEGSWSDTCTSKNCRITLRNLERASWCYVRAMSLGNNESSPWSAPVGIVVV